MYFILPNKKPNMLHPNEALAIEALVLSHPSFENEMLERDKQKLRDTIKKIKALAKSQVEKVPEPG